MLFNSLQFFIFFGIILTIYYFIPRRFKWILLLVASYYFYMCWKWEYIFLIVISTIVDYITAIKIEQKPHYKKLLLGISLVSNLGLLFYFKYYNFFIDSVNTGMDLFNSPFILPFADVILPVGISFYTFQTLSYTIEVYYGRQKAEKHFGKFALYVSYFPQLVAGPIERPQNLIHQLNNPQPILPANVVKGARLILWGLFKKVVVADRLAYFVDIVYNDPTAYHGLAVVIATIFFAFQIYCDFSGYSDIAIGVAKIMGVDLMKNFNTPYFSKSVKEFWSRWHISLSTWFRDYVYIPLGGNRVSVNKWVVNLFITFLVSGIWHGANWTFVIWGAIHGLIISLESLNSKKKFFKFALPPILANILTFSIVCFAWIFFRANSVQDAFLLIENMFVFDVSFVQQVRHLNAANLYNLLLGVPLIILLLMFERGWQLDFIKNSYYRSKPLRYASYMVLVILIAMFGVFVDQSSFIYFQF